MNAKAGRTAHRVLGRAERGRDGDLPEVRPAGFLLLEVQDGLRRVNRRTASDTDDDVRADFLEQLQAVLYALDGRVLPDLVERRAEGVVILQDILDLLDHVCL